MRKECDWHQVVKEALREDIGKADITSEATLTPDISARATIYSKQTGVLAGIDIAAFTFQAVDNTLQAITFFKDGDLLSPGNKIMTISGKAVSLLSAERVALNFLSHLSGIATLTRKFVDRVKTTNTKIVDTRKTTPLLRALEKQAVRAGGGNNHRMGLYDMILIKENHVKAAGGIGKAITQTHKYLNAMKIEAKIEIETTNLDEVKEALRYKIDRVMLDNMSLEEIRKAVTLAGRRVELEASGGISLKNVREIARIGVDYISIGALTHSFKTFDFTLLIDNA
jgi:nicotinate-nucleotide pyrophosphorylase (carboxylating)